MDLSKRETPSNSIPQTTFRQETTLPRADTRKPDVEINAVIRKPNVASNAEALAKILGVAEDTADKVIGQKMAEQDTKDSAQAAFDFAQGNQNTDLYKRSRAYYQAWQLEGAKAKSVDIGQKAADEAQEALNNPDATVEDVDAAIEAVFHANTHDEHGNLLDFGTPEAKLTLAHSIAEVKARLMPEVHKAITERQNEKLLGTTFENLVTERDRGAPIGDPKAVPKVDPLAPLKDTTGTITAPKEPERVKTSILSLQEPFKGFSTVHLTGHIGDAREGHTHNGEDYPVRAGTPIQAPMQGEVVASFSNALGGNQVRVKLANGAIVGFAHLSERKVAVGDKVAPGQLLGLSGSTGHSTGAHVHMTVEVDGKKVSPRKYFAQNSGEQVITTGAEPQLADVPPETTVAQAEAYYKPGLNVETFLSRLPPSVSKGAGKTWFIQGAIAKAYETKDYTLLNGLEESHRADGTPSFTPEEQLKISQARDTIKEKVRSENERARTEAQGKNLDAILNLYNKGTPPSDSWLAAQGEKGLIDPKQAYTLIDHNRAMRRMAASEAKAEERAKRQDAEMGITAEVNGLASAMMAGVPEALSTTPESLRQRFKNGDFGPIGSKTAMAHYRTLLAALTSGRQRVEANPEFAGYGAMLQQFKPVSTKQGSNPLLIAKPDTGTHLDAGTYAEMVAFYKEQVDTGKSPGDAYRAAVDRYVRKAQATNNNPMAHAINRLAYLKCKRAGICK